MSLALHARPIPLTMTGGPSAPQPSGEIFAQVRSLFRKNWKPGRKSACSECKPPPSKNKPDKSTCSKPPAQRWKDALAAADKLRDKFGESSIKLAAGRRGTFRERTQDNPADLPGKKTGEKR